MNRIAIFASGSGSNAENIFDFFKSHKDVEISVILSNNSKAGVLERASRLGVSSLVFQRDAFYKSDEVVDHLLGLEIDLIVLAGFLWLVPPNLIKAFPNKIINIHPALLPKYGGKGMYGDYVHQAVCAAKEKESGITIHYVNEEYDEGNVIFQKTVPLEPGEDPRMIAEKIHELEYAFFPQVISDLLEKA